MRELTLEEHKKIMLEILANVDSFCNEKGLRYYVFGGTLIGAIRHKGFIPWDDDIDIAMPRQDYECFIKAFPSIGKYKVLNEKNTKGYYLPFAKVVDEDTVLIEDTDAPTEIGIYIDVFPMDSMGKSYDEALKKYRHLRVWHKLLSAKMYKKHEKRKWYKNVVSTICFYLPVSKHRIIEKINTIAVSGSNEDDKYIAEATYMLYGDKEIFESAWFDSLIDVPFENLTVKAPEQYDKILTNMYGDYMTPPPKEKQVSHHKMKAWIRDEQ